MASCHTHADCFFRRVWHLAIPTQIASLGGYDILPYPRRLRLKGSYQTDAGQKGKGHAAEEFFFVHWFR